MSKPFSSSHRLVLARIAISACLLFVARVAAAEKPAEEAPGSTQVREALDAAAEAIAGRQPNEAINGLRKVRAAEPQNPWMLTLTGAALVQLGRPHGAIEQLRLADEILRNGPSPDPDLERLIARYEREARRELLNISYRVGLAYDTNVSFANDAVPGLDIVSGRADGVFGSDFRLDYALLASQTDSIVAGARLGHTWNFSVEQFDVQDYGGYVRYGRRIGDSWLAEMQYDYDLILLDRDSFVSAHRLMPSMMYQWQSEPGRLRPDRTRVYAQIEFDDFRYETDPVFDRDSTVWGIGVDQELLFQPLSQLDWTWRIGLAYRFSCISTDGREFDQMAHDMGAAATIPLINPNQPGQYLLLPDKELLLRLGCTWRIEDYRNASLIDASGDARTDLITTYTVGLSQVLIDDPKLGTMTLHGLIQWTQSESNVTSAQQNRGRTTYFQPFTYDKEVYGIQLEWAW